MSETVVAPIAFGAMLLYALLSPGAARPLHGVLALIVWAAGVGLIALGLHRWRKERNDDRA